jgi:hypothetical protein
MATTELRRYLQSLASCIENQDREGTAQLLSLRDAHAHLLGPKVDRPTDLDRGREMARERQRETERQRERWSGCTSRSAFRTWTATRGRTSAGWTATWPCTTFALPLPPPKATRRRRWPTSSRSAGPFTIMCTFPLTHLHTPSHTFTHTCSPLALLAHTGRPGVAHAHGAGAGHQLVAEAFERHLL